MGLQQLGLTDVTCPQVSFERLGKGGAIATNLVELWHSPPTHVLGGSGIPLGVLHQQVWTRDPAQTVS